MLQGIVIGHATATIKHRSLNGWRMAIVQPIGPDGQPEADPQIAVDRHGAAPGHLGLRQASRIGGGNGGVVRNEG